MLANLARGGVFGTGVVLVPETLYPLTLGNAYYGLLFFCRWKTGVNNVIVDVLRFTSIVSVAMKSELKSLVCSKTRI